MKSSLLPQSGFTLLEILVFTGLTSILLLSASAIFMTFLVNQSAIMQRQKIKIEGDNALKQMTQILREAKTVENCPGSAQRVVYENVFREQGEFYIHNYFHDGNEMSRIASKSSSGTVYLTSEDFAASNFSADCRVKDESYLLKIKFSLSSKGPDFEAHPFTQTFENSVSLRN